MTQDFAKMYDTLKTYLNQFDPPISDEFWVEIKRESKIIELKKGEVLNQIGSLHDYAYFIISGGFVTSIISEDGDNKAVWFNFDTKFKVLVCPDSYFLGESTKYELKALENSRVIRIQKQKIDSWSRKYMAFNQFYFQDVVSGFTVMNEIRAYKLSHNPLQFLNYIELNFPVYLERLSSKDMAFFLGVTPEWYSKLKKRKMTQ